MATGCHSSAVGSLARRTGALRTLGRARAGPARRLADGPGGDGRPGAGTRPDSQGHDQVTGAAGKATDAGPRTCPGQHPLGKEMATARGTEDDCQRVGQFPFGWNTMAHSQRCRYGTLRYCLPVRSRSECGIEVGVGRGDPKKKGLRSSWTRGLCPLRRRPFRRAVDSAQGDGARIRKRAVRPAGKRHAANAGPLVLLPALRLAQVVFCLRHASVSGPGPFSKTSDACSRIWLARRQCGRARSLAPPGPRYLPLDATDHALSPSSVASASAGPRPPRRGRRVRHSPPWRSGRWGRAESDGPACRRNRGAAARSKRPATVVHLKTLAQRSMVVARFDAMIRTFIKHLHA